MQTIEVTEKWTVAKKSVKAIEVRSLKFAEFSTLATSVAEATPGDGWTAAFRTARMQKQCTLVLEDNQRVNPEPITILGMPWTVARLVVDALAVDNILSKPGTLSGDGDGVTTPIVLTLGEPIAGGDGKAIEELEFMVKTYGDVEKVLGEPNDYMKALALARHVATPIGMMAMPSWAVDQIGRADGELITNKIVPRFFGPRAN